MRTPKWLPWALGSAIAFSMLYVPFLAYRYEREHYKRLRPVVEGRVFRSGCLSADGFRDAVARHKIKTIITLWDENPDPSLPNDRFTFGTIKESELCKSLNVDYRFIFVKLNPNDQDHVFPPQAVKEFWEVMDNEASYPVLFHCKAGLHRTGVIGAIYRMEYQGWSREDSMRELRSHGFGEYTGNYGNPYIRQYVLPYRPRAMAERPRTVPANLTSRVK